jgi:hypothetical protein
MTPAVVEGQNHESYASLLRLNPQGATPPTATYISADNQLALYAAGSFIGSPIIAVARILLPDGKVSLNQFSFTLQAVNIPNAAQWNLPEGFLLSLVVYNSAASYNRYTFVQVQLVQTSQNPPIFTSVLCAGYPTKYVPLSFPVGVNLNTLDCVGGIRPVTGTRPAAGNNFLESAPSNVQRRIISLNFTLTTSAAVANRDVYLQVAASGNLVFNLLLNVTSQAAGLTWNYQVGAGLSQITSVAQGSVSAPLPTELRLNAGDAMQTSIAGLQVADQLSAPVYQLEEWQCP